MNVEISTYVHVDSIEEAELLAQTLAEAMPNEFKLDETEPSPDTYLNSIVILRAIPEVWHKLPMEDFIERLANRAFQIIVPGRDKTLAWVNDEEKSADAV